MDGDWSKINRKVNEEGREEFSYDGAGIRRCVRDSAKECIYCGACFSEKMKEFAEASKGKPPSGRDMLAPFYKMAQLPRTGKYDKYVHTYKPEYHDDPNFFKSPLRLQRHQRDGGVQAPVPVQSR